MTSFEAAAQSVYHDGYNEGADDWYRKAWEDVGETLDQAVEEKWPLADLVDTLRADVRKYRPRA